MRFRNLVIAACVTLYATVGAAQSPTPSMPFDWSTVGEPHEGLGFSVSGAGDVNGDGFGDLLCASPVYYPPPGGPYGRVRLYLGSIQGLSATSSWVVEGEHQGAHFGIVAAGAGDVNGDGFSDIIVGSPDYSGAYAQEGAAYVYLGSAQGPSGAPDWTRMGGEPGARMGGSVDSAGDVNGDGFDD